MNGTNTSVLVASQNRVAICKHRLSVSVNNLTITSNNDSSIIAHGGLRHIGDLAAGVRQTDLAAVANRKGNTGLNIQRSAVPDPQGLKTICAQSQGLVQSSADPFASIPIDRTDIIAQAGPVAVGNVELGIGRGDRCHR